MSQHCHYIVAPVLGVHFADLLPPALLQMSLAEMAFQRKTILT